MDTENVLRFKKQILEASRNTGLEPALIAGLIECESSGNPYAIRVERGFWKRYYTGIKALFTTPKRLRLRRWFKYPDLVSTSYGLCQIMLPVAMENGFDNQFPTGLLDPRANINLGASILSKHIARFGGDRNKGLLRYNGGGDPMYASKVLNAANRYRYHMDRNEA